MVILSRTLLAAKRSKKRTFLDSLRLTVRAGSGGGGHPKYGGVGGDGGDVYVVGDQETTLLKICRKMPAKRVVAGHGEPSTPRRLLGAKGEDFTIKSPYGVILFADGKKLGEINTKSDSVLVAKGGRGGDKNTGFCGLKGESRVVTFDLKLIADVGLVGFPNAGKSSILSILSNATPKIASYPFTTIQPSIGIIEYPDLRSISVADLPGLIEGAHANVGMGHKFLKHVERTKLLLIVVSVEGFSLGPMYQSRNCLETIVLLNKELELYKEELLDLPAVLVVNKMDLPWSQNVFEEVNKSAGELEKVFDIVPEQMRPQRALQFREIVPLSALENKPEQINLLKNLIRDTLDESVIEDESELNLLQSLNDKYKVRGPQIV